MQKILNAIFHCPNYIKQILTKPFRPISKNDPLAIDGIDPEDHIQLEIKKIDRFIYIPW